MDNAGGSGLELEFNEQLTGQNGVVLTAVNAWGYTLEQSYETEQFPVEGSSLWLTIDANIQHYLENALNYAVQEHHVAARAVGIVLDVNTGAVLAMSTTPAYDPNQPRVRYDEAARAAVDALSGEQRTAALQLAQQTQWRNKAVSDLYEPGSVFKLITCAAALDAGAITRHSTFYCGDSISVAGTRFHCANHKRHGTQTVTQALENSCNQSFIQIGARLGKQAFCDYFAAFGLREPTGIDLPAEPKKSLYYPADRMGPVELASCAFGQSSKISYLEMASAVCAEVNGGKLMQPYLVSDILAPDGSILQHNQPVCRRQVIQPATSATMREMMEAVVLYGGGRNAQLAGYRVGGKRGTSQKLDSADEKARIASFVAVAPIADPQFLCLVCLDEPHSWTTAGGSLSAPVCAEVLEQTLVYKGVPRAAAAVPAEQTAALRRKCFESDVKLVVVKNTLLGKALEKVEKADADLVKVLEGPTSIMFTNVAKAPAVLIKEFRKKSEKPVLKAAFAEGCVYVGDDQLDALCNIKSKEELIADIVALLQSPAKNVISALQANAGQKIAGLVKTLESRNN